jgi:hypothetical protein
MSAVIKQKRIHGLTLAERMARWLEPIPIAGCHMTLSAAIRREIPK